MRSNKFRNKLVVKLLGVVAISSVISFITLLLFFRLVAYLFELNNITNLNITPAMLLTALGFLLTLSTFIVSFVFFIRKKIRYLREISENVHQIANGKLGQLINLKGNDELTTLARNINNMSTELELKFQNERKLEVERNELISNVSHDLRSPLTSVIGYVDLLIKNKYQNHEQYKEYLYIINQKSNRLKILIEELFEYSRLSNPYIKLNKNVMNMVDLVEQVVGEHTPIFEQEKMHILKNIDDYNMPVSMDVEKIVRVYENLFVNSLKYSVKPSKIKIDLKKNGELAIFSISNEIEKDASLQMNKLFDRFFVGEKARTNNEGTGLGLAIAKKIVDLHHGRIYADLNENLITFVIEFPIQET
ncbi:sensor histidine kinase [Alkalicoccobacillus murimartini]|uniref:histidine kinase n=1 Tax=Alkalicoccobacillus murimartini TaxID=171685 RepID=A0ABT9YLB4_9BACI|nr:HAMP domain-containing sensor histidine kinase [Alkalicoccobacillus murimartini]MDQ0208671.1 signal transduction histidine kinase [Alkalicoccobacillus murimartini]